METLKNLLKNPWVQGAIGIIALLVIVPLLLSKVFEVSFGSIGKMFGLETKEDKKEREEKKNIIIGAGKDLGYTDASMQDYERRARAIADALGTDAWWDWTQDVDKALKELIGLDKKGYQFVSQFYAMDDIGDGNLTNDLKKYATEEKLKAYNNIIN